MLDTGSALLLWKQYWVPICVTGLFSSVMHSAHGIEDTNTLSLDVYSFPLTHRQEVTRRHSLGIDTLTNGRKGVNKGLGGKEVLWRKREDSLTIKTTISPNSQISVKC